MDERTRLKYLEIASKSLAEIIKTVIGLRGELVKLDDLSEDLSEKTKGRYCVYCDDFIVEFYKLKHQAEKLEQHVKTKLEAELFLMEALRAHVRRAIKKAINNAKGWRELWHAIKFAWAIRQTRKKIAEELND